MKYSLVFAVLAMTLVGCSDDDETPNATTDTGSGEVDGPITTRPDDGVDTATAMDTATSGDTSTGDSAASDSASMSDAPSDAAGGAKVVTVGAGGSSFSPKTLTIKVGEKVRWVFSGVGHNVISGSTCVADGKFCSPADMSCGPTTPTVAMGATYEHTFTTAGTYPYFCNPHCAFGMTGTITVTE